MIAVCVSGPMNYAGADQGSILFSLPNLVWSDQSEAIFSQNIAELYRESRMSAWAQSVKFSEAGLDL